MRLITLLNHCEHFSGFVYDKARLCQHSRTIEIEMRPRRGSKPVCSGCHERGTAYDQLGLRRFEFVPVWGFIVLLLYRMRRVDCRACGVRVEQVPWATGKHQLTKAYMLFLAHWARKLSWQETAASFRSSWDKVFLDDWCQQVMRSRIQPMKKIAMTMRSHRELLLNYFRAKRRLSSGVV